MKKDFFETHALKKKRKEEGTVFSSVRAQEKPGDLLEAELDTSKKVLDCSDVDTSKDRGGLSETLESTFEPEGGFEFPEKTAQTPQSYIVRVSYPTSAQTVVNESEFCEELLEDFQFGDIKQAALSDFGGEVLLEVLDRRKDPPERVLTWIKKDEIPRMISWLRWWSANHP